MATGYTSDLPRTFPEFALRCARAFGALVEMREEPLDTPIPDEFLPNNYHLEAITKAEKRLAELEKWSDQRAEREAKKAYDEEARSRKECGEKNERTGRSYIAMLKQVGKWVPPTKDHEGLKSFMVEQLADSIELDCLHTPTMPQRFSGKQYRAQLIKSARRDIAYHTKNHKEEVRRAHERSEWVRALRQSLGSRPVL